MKKHRIEYDSLGKKAVPADKYYGVQTQRAIENFTISGVSISHYPALIQALAAVKYAATQTNLELHLLDKQVAEAIMAAAKEILDGQHLEHFPVDVIQGGAGTSSNMNINEVLANRALELLGHQRGDYKFIHPNNHVNKSQSTNDVYPTAIRIAIIWSTKTLLKKMDELKDAFLQKGEKFAHVIKMARTELREAVPITLGQEFHAYGITIEEDIERIKEASKLCCEINMGATAVGTGINTKAGYAQKVRQHLSQITNIELVTAKDLIEATSDAGVFISFSSMLKRFAVKLNKICNDLRLMSASVNSGWGEIFLPAVQPGSSIMPGKVNPVIPEVINQICFQVIGNDTTITIAASNGQLELNAFAPIIIYNLLESLRILTKGCSVLRKKCILGIKANKKRCKEEVIKSPGLLTALSPYIGYETASKLAKQATKSKETLFDLIKKSKLLTPKKIRELLSPNKMTRPNIDDENDNRK